MTDGARSPVVLRPFDAGDVAAYRALMLEAYADPAPGSPLVFTSSAPERAAAAEDWWRGRIAGALGCGTGAFRGATLDGAAALAFQDKVRTAHKALLVGMFVRPSQRGRGLGMRLLQAVLAQARGRGAALVQLGVIEGNDAALALYRRAGFEVFGRRADGRARRRPLLRHAAPVAARGRRPSGAGRARAATASRRRPSPARGGPATGQAIMHACPRPTSPSSPSRWTAATRCATTPMP